MAENSNPGELLTLTTEIVAGHLGNNKVPTNDIPALIKQIYEALALVSGRAAPAERLQPAVSIRKSITPDHIICLEDGKKLRMLKRHLKTSYNLTPDEYRERWGLPADYPMVAPNYAAQRSALAKKIGLGTRPRKRKRRA
jgi:predicted transcriptional regulator